MPYADTRSFPPTSARIYQSAGKKNIFTFSINYSVWLSCQALSDYWYHTICHGFLAGCQWSSHHKHFHIVPSCRHDRINNQATSRLIGCDGRRQKHWLPAICHRSVEATLYGVGGVKSPNFPFWFDVLLSHHNMLLAEESRSDSWMSFLQPNVPAPFRCK